MGERGCAFRTGLPPTDDRLVTFDAAGVVFSGVNRSEVVVSRWRSLVFVILPPTRHGSVGSHGAAVIGPTLI